MTRRCSTVAVLLVALASSSGCLGTGLVYLVDNTLPPPFDTLPSRGGGDDHAFHSGVCYTFACIEAGAAVGAAVGDTEGLAAVLGILALGDFLSGIGYGELARSARSPRRSFITPVPNGAALTCRF